MIRTCLALLFLLGALPVQLQAEQFLLFPFNPELSVFMQTYQADPTPERVLDVFFETDLAEFDREAEATEQPHSRSILIAFFVQILNDNPSVTLQFAERLVSERKPAHASLGCDVIAAASTLDRNKALELVMNGYSLPPEARQMVESREQFDYQGLHADHHQTLDILWACYFASGDESFVRSIAAPLRSHPVTREEAVERIGELGANNLEPDTPQYREFWALVLGEAARMGLGINAQAHAGVRSIVRQLVQEGDEPLGSILEPMLRPKVR